MQVSVNRKNGMVGSNMLSEQPLKSVGTLKKAIESSQGICDHENTSRKAQISRVVVATYSSSSSLSSEGKATSSSSSPLFFLVDMIE